MPDAKEPFTREQYDAYWRREPYTDEERAEVAEAYYREPVDRPHVDSVFQELCGIADQWGLGVFITVDMKRVQGPEERQWRMLDKLICASHRSQPIITVPINNADPHGLRTAALKALERFEAA